MRETMPEALVALGGNVGDARATLDRAVAAFCDGDAVRLLARSSDYRTPPWGVADQPSFVNLCLAVTTTLSPHDLLARALKKAKVRVVRDPMEAADGADVVNTDVWASMGQEDEQRERARAFANYTVNAKLMKRASKKAVR